MAEMTLGQRIRRRRAQLSKERGWTVTQAELAEELGVSQQTLARWEQDGSKPREMEHWKALAELLDLSVPELSVIAATPLTPEIERVPVEERLELVQAAVEAMTEVLEGIRRELAPKRASGSRGAARAKSPRR